MQILRSDHVRVERAKPPQRDELFMGEELPLRAAELREIGLPVR
ncbi:hypothetical protein [Sorangium cellulosum]|uniref:Uncharacterized protein n=1 Tax=Sorangium cellulosum So0157-2 TaxID=1254432 RepID=S4Y8C0_SORCE|nr:hypothetical protein [Sorangium cellulosum]AGP39118.1 hypothetical protein SCE1572_34325 [Sorangium cellulosum So0157-2]